MNVRTKLLITALLITPPGAFIACARAGDELESQHARIGQIEVEVEELFQDEVRALAAPYRIANGLHIATRTPTITQQLLFRHSARRVLFASLTASLASQLDADPFAADSGGWLRDIGIGLRLGSARSGLGNVLHVDLAFPLDGGRDLDSAQLLIETKRSF